MYPTVQPPSTETPVPPCVDCGTTAGPKRKRGQPRRVQGRCFPCHRRYIASPEWAARESQPCVDCGTVTGAIRPDRDPQRPYRIQGRCRACYQVLQRQTTQTLSAGHRDRYEAKLLEGMNAPGPRPNDPSPAEIEAACAAIQHRVWKLAPRQSQRVYHHPALLGEGETS